MSEKIVQLNEEVRLLHMQKQKKRVMLLVSV